MMEHEGPMITTMTVWTSRQQSCPFYFCCQEATTGASDESDDDDDGLDELTRELSVLH